MTRERRETEPSQAWGRTDACAPERGKTPAAARFGASSSTASLLPKTSSEPTLPPVRLAATPALYKSYVLYYTRPGA
jgi:hypothetical protein